MMTTPGIRGLTDDAVATVEGAPRSGPLPTGPLRLAQRMLRDAGMVVVENAYDAARIETLRHAYDDLLARERAAGATSSVQPSGGADHIQMRPPLVTPFSDVDVVAHPAVTQILAAVLGDNFRCASYNSNTALPGSGRQRVHRDRKPLFGPELSVPTPPIALVVNIPLCDFTEHNGSTELWPTSHLIVDTAEDAEEFDDDDFPDLTARSTTLASIRLNLPSGAVAIRDLRLWHRGMPNTSNAERPMLALVYQRAWLPPHQLGPRVPGPTWAQWPEHVRTIFAAAPVDDAADTSAT